MKKGLMIAMFAIMCLALTSNAKTNLTGNWTHEMTASELAMFATNDGYAKVSVPAGTLDMSFSGADAFALNLKLKMAIAIQEGSLGVSYTVNLGYQGTYEFTAEKDGKGELDLDADSTDVTMTDMELTGSMVASLDAPTQEVVKKSIEDATKQQFKAVDMTDGDWTVKQVTADKLVLVSEEKDGKTMEFTFTKKQ